MTVPHDLPPPLLVNNVAVAINEGFDLSFESLAQHSLCSCVNDFIENATRLASTGLI